MEFYVAGGLAVDPVHGSVVAQGFLDSGVYLVRVVTQFGPGIWMICQVVQQVGQQVGGRFVARNQ